MSDAFDFTPHDWFWIVGGDESRFWSSAQATYVDEFPEGAGLSRILSEDELWGVLRIHFPAGLPADMPPLSVTPAQAKIALFEAELLDQVEALVADYPYRPVSIWWTSALAFERGHAYINALALELDLSDEQVDALFITAARR